MKNRLHQYELKRLDKSNVQRSLQGAAKRSTDGLVLIGFCTKSFVFPDEYDQSKISDGGAYIEAWTNGQFTDDFLHIVVSGWRPEQGGKKTEAFEHEVLIKLYEVDGNLHVSYLVVPEKPAMICFDTDCEARPDCLHGKPHNENKECQHICGADEPCSRCFPVKEAI